MCFHYTVYMSYPLSIVTALFMFDQSHFDDANGHTHPCFCQFVGEPAVNLAHRSGSQMPNWANLLTCHDGDRGELGCSWCQLTVALCLED